MIIPAANQPGNERNSSHRTAPGGRPPLVPAPDTIPATIRLGPRWICWLLKPRTTGKPEKPPVDPKTGTVSDATDPRTWAAFEEAADAVRRFRLAGVGRVVIPSDGLSFIDLDDCRDPHTGAADPWAEELLAKFGDTYAEASPSGTGFHVVVRGHPPHGTPCRSGRVECYADNRYFTFTGWVKRGHPVAVAPAGDRLHWLAEKFLRPSVPPPGPPQFLCDASGGLSDDQVIRRASACPQTGPKFRRLWAGDTIGYRSHSEADLALVRYLAFWTGPHPDRIDALFRQSGLMRDKWAKRRHGQTYAERTIARALAGMDSFFGRRPALPPVPPSTTCVCESVPLLAPAPRARIGADLDRLEAYVHELHLRHARPVGLSVRQGAELLGLPFRTAARRINSAVESGRLVLVSTGTHESGLASTFQPPEPVRRLPASPTPPKSKPSAAPTSPPPYARTPGGLVAVWRWSPREGRWLHYGDCRGLDVANEIAGRHMATRAGYWSVDGELRRFVRGRGLRVGHGTFEQGLAATAGRPHTREATS